MFENTLNCSARDRPCFIKICLLSQRANVSHHLGPRPTSTLGFTDLNSPEIFDEYTRRQYVSRAPERNPFGTAEEPAKFAEFDAFTKASPNRIIPIGFC